MFPLDEPASPLDEVASPLDEDGCGDVGSLSLQASAPEIAPAAASITIQPRDVLELPQSAVGLRPKWVDFVIFAFHKSRFTPATQRGAIISPTNQRSSGFV